MNLKKLHIILFTLLLVYIASPNLYSQSTGLGFYGQGHQIDKRTSLELFQKKSFKTNNSFSIEFDLSFEKNYESYFGYIFRMHSSEGTNIDLIYENKDNFAPSINLIIGDNVLLITIPIPMDFFYNWKHVKIDFDIINNLYTLKVEDYQIEKKGEILPAKNSLKIYFGANHNKEIETIDLPNMSVRDIIISQNNKNTHHWPLNNSEGIICLDIISHKKAIVDNPFWLHQNHSKWKLVHEFITNDYSQICFSQKENRFFIVSPDSLISFQADTENTYNRINFRKRISFNSGDQILYDSINNNILRYSVDQNLISKYNFETNTWSKEFPLERGLTEYWQHNKFISPIDTSLRIIGGYGQFSFKNECQSVTLNNDAWEIFEPDKSILAPRYLSGLGTNSSADTVYILGGYGSLDGDQKINPNNWYELIRHIPLTGEMERLFRYNNSNLKGFCFANSILIQDNSFYALAFSKFEYNNHLQLYKGSLKSSQLEAFGSKISFPFHDIMTFVDLFYSKQEAKLYATVSFFNDNNQSDIKVYALNFPPEKVILSENVIKKDPHLFYWIMGVLLFISLFIVLLIFYKRRVRKSYSESDTNSFPSRDTGNRQLNVEDVNTASNEETLTNAATEKCIPNDKNIISLFGGFQIIDNNGKDITGKFTPLLKDLFLIIFLNSYGDKKGISSANLREELWSHKTDKEARNNRAVNMSRLKTLISSVGGSSISKETGYWKVSIDYSKVCVDYKYFYDIVHVEFPSQKQILKLIDITRSNPFLKNLSNEWLDPFKADISNDTVDTLINWATSNTDKYKPAEMIPLADAVFKFDPINEEAMELKCKSLVKLGKHSLAKSTYDSFFKEYELLYGEKFQKSFTEVIAF